MKRLLYISAARGDMTEADIACILAASRRNNRDAEITGMLLHLDGGFMQVLEGPEDSVNETYARIAADSRHGQVVVLWSEETDSHIFPDWTMGYDALPAHDARWPGALRLDPRKPVEALASGAGPEIMDLMRGFYHTATAARLSPALRA